MRRHEKVADGDDGSVKVRRETLGEVLWVWDSITNKEYYISLAVI